MYVYKQKLHERYAYLHNIDGQIVFRLHLL